MFGEWILALKNLFLPIFCQICGRRLLTEENGFFCPTCWEQSPRITRPFCTVCGRPHPGMVGFGMPTNFPCTRCRALGEQPFRRIYGAARYEGAVAEAVKRFKFYDRPHLSHPLAELMTEFAALELPHDAYECVIPVPLHRVRLRERGFNQSELLAQRVLPLFPNARLDLSLRRIRRTKVQSRIRDEAERRANVRGAFAVEGEGLDGATVLLIDDVVTTGGTVTECAKALRDAGVDTVDIFAVALAGHAGASPLGA